VEDPLGGSVLFLARGLGEGINEKLPTGDFESGFDEASTGATVFGAVEVGADVSTVAVEGADVSTVMLEGVDVLDGAYTGAIVFGAVVAGADVFTVAVEGVGDMPTITGGLETGVNVLSPTGATEIGEIEVGPMVTFNSESLLIMGERMGANAG
jgi:hypothetical protein